MSDKISKAADIALTPLPTEEPARTEELLRRNTEISRLLEWQKYIPDPDLTFICFEEGSKDDYLEILAQDEYHAAERFAQSLEDGGDRDILERSPIRIFVECLEGENAGKIYPMDIYVDWKPVFTVRGAVK